MKESKECSTAPDSWQFHSACSSQGLELRKFYPAITELFWSTLLALKPTPHTWSGCVHLCVCFSSPDCKFPESRNVYAFLLDLHRSHTYIYLVQNSIKNICWVYIWMAGHVWHNANTYKTVIKLLPLPVTYLSEVMKQTFNNLLR